jgi:hypothetical protein
MAAEKAMKFVKDGAVIGGTAALASILGEWAVSKTTWSEGARGGVQAVGGVAIGMVLATKVPRVATGFVAYGFMAGVRGVAQEVALRQYLAQTTQPQGAPGSSTAPGSSGALYDGRESLAGQYANVYAMAR